MKPHSSLCIVLVTLGALLVLAVYVALLVDWIDEYRSGYYSQHRLEQVIESVIILAYTALGIRFGFRRIDLQH